MSKSFRWLISNQSIAKTNNLNLGETGRKKMLLSNTFK
jgi:hypothetical protein